MAAVVLMDGSHETSQTQFAMESLMSAIVFAMQMHGVRLECLMLEVGVVVDFVEMQILFKIPGVRVFPRHWLFAGH